jgi:glycosyltransferase involved in cell wall biosynthesis
MKSEEIQIKRPRLEKPVRITEQVWPEGMVPVVSICCITYQHVNFIRDALEGFFMQETTFPVEIIIRDDASTDGTAEIVREYQEKYPQLIRSILHTENQWYEGKRAFPEVFAMARGEFIALCEGDDYWISPSKIQSQVGQMKKKPDASFCFHNTLTIDESRIAKGEICPKDKSLLHSLDELFLNNFIHTSSILFRRSKFSGFPECLKNSPMGDWPLCILLAEKGPFLYLDKIMSHYRLHSGSSWSARTQADRSEKTCLFFDLLLDYFKNDQKYLSKVIRGYKMHCLGAARELKVLGDKKNASFFYQKVIEVFADIKISERVQCRNTKTEALQKESPGQQIDFIEINKIAECFILQEQKIRELNHKITSIKNSKIWMFSWPIRFLHEKFSKLLQSPQKHARSTSHSYAEWLACNEAPLDACCKDLLIEIARMNPAPVFSVVMPVHNTKAEWLREAIDSVRNQIYPHWQLCIADDASTAPHVRETLEHYRQLDTRIQVVYRQESGHISAASNSALELATGDFVAFLDHDHVLPGHALYHVAARLQQNPGAQIIYSDEDKLAEDGYRAEPHFKSDWNPDLFFSQNYITHLCVIRRSLVEKIHGFRLGVEGSQDYDLLLRCLPYVEHQQIVHIPRILYHLRSHPESTAQSSGSKSYTQQAGLNALKDYLSMQAHDARAELGLRPNTYRVRWPIPAPEPLVSLLIPTRDRRELVETAISSIIEKSDYQNFEILILDNGSTDPDTLEYFARIPREDSRVRVVPYRHPFNYSAMNNFGVTQARGEVIGFINNDIEVISSEWLAEMVSHALRPQIGCVGAKLYYANKTLQHCGVILGLGGVAGHGHKHFSENASGYFNRARLIQNISAVTAACLVMRKCVFEEVGGFDEENLTIAFNDVDLCLKVREAGYRNLWTPYAELYHYESLSRGYEDTAEKIQRFQCEINHMKEKWGSKLLQDPFYNPNLTLDREDFSLR